MVCPRCGQKIENKFSVCRFCGYEKTDADILRWSELPAMPVFNKSNSGNSNEETDQGSTFFSKRMKRNFLRIFMVFMEICILAGVISGIYAWKLKTASVAVPDAQNIVYSSEDIVMMLVKRRSEWLPEKPENGYNACCFLDTDFDGSPELISISYDTETFVTNIMAFRVRNCTLDRIPIDYDETEGFFDIDSGLSLCYAPDTKEMLYFSTDYRKGENGNISALGCFYIHENQIFKEYYLNETLSDGIYSYEYYDEEQSRHDINRQDFIKRQDELSNRLTNLKLQYEWISDTDFESISSQKLAALLLRSYDSFRYDSSGLALQ
jgi:hypothetical protein